MLGTVFLLFIGTGRGRIIKGGGMGTELQALLEAAKQATPSEEQNEEQRRSFAYGNTKIENSRITRETVDEQAEELKRS
jgi:hypothetical protein